MNRAAFLDRDGVVNEKRPQGEYVTRWEEMHFLPGVAPAIAMLNRAGFRVIVVSNQRCVAKGLITTADLEAMHQRMCNTLASAGATIDGTYYCPHDTEPSCNCRKPAPGMLLDAARAHRIDLSASWMIGDSETDVEAGKNAGCKTARLLSGDAAADGNADMVASSLLAVVLKILKWEQSPVADAIFNQQDGRAGEPPSTRG
jgi:D-glycero-D-manno-heptose 1,7-bisphosphate phosphatase